jgi:predicted N-acetyltransferase YhbS
MSEVSSLIAIRRARPEDVRAIVDLTNQVFRPKSSGKPPSMGLQFPLFLSERNADSLFIAEDDGRIVAHNGLMLSKIIINGHSVTMASMGAVCTDPDYQGQGIATRVLHEALTWLRDKGVGLLTISGGRGLYTRNGAIHTSGAKRFTLRRDCTSPDAGSPRLDGICTNSDSGSVGPDSSVTDPDSGPVGPDGSLTDLDSGLVNQTRAFANPWSSRTIPDGRCDNPDSIEALATSLGLLSLTYYGRLISTIADEMADLYQTEPVRYERPRREFPILLKAAPPVHDVPFPPDLVALTSWAGSCLVAYVLGYQKDGEFRVIEYAGDRLAICLLLRQMVASAAADSVVVRVPLYDLRLISQLEGLGYAAQCESYGATFMAPDPKALWQQVRPILRERIREVGYAQVPDEPKVGTDDGQKLISFLFGAIDRQAYGQPWDTALPLPLPWMEGLNFI